MTRKKKEEERQERKHMDGMIAAHFLKQRSKMDFKTYFNFKAPNKHLPKQLEQVEEVKQFMVLNGITDNYITSKTYAGGASAETDFNMALHTSKDLTNSNTFTCEMAMKNIKDFKGRCRTNMVARVANRINNIEKKAKDQSSIMSSTQGGTQDDRRRSKANKSIISEKVISYAEIKKWNQQYRLDGKSVY